MLAKSFLILLFAPLVAGECSVCGEGLTVTKREEYYAFPGQPVVQCGELEQAGESGLLAQDYCEELPELIEKTCGCEEVEGCSVCGEGMKVSKLDEIFAFPQQPVVQCGELENAARIGVVPLEYCPILPDLIKDICGCIPKSQPIPPTRAPTRNEIQPKQPAPQLPNQNSPTPQSAGLSTGAIIGIIIGVVAVGGVLILLVYMSTSKMRKNEPIITAEATPVTAVSAVPPLDAYTMSDEKEKASVTDKDLKL